MAGKEKIDVVLNVRKGGRNVTFGPTLMALDGEVRMEDIRGNIPAVMNMIGGTVPGHQIQVDLKRRFVRFVHRLLLPENEKLWKQIQSYDGSELIRWRKIGELPEVVEHNVAETEWPTWLFHIRKGIDIGAYHTVTSVEFPGYKDIFALGFPIKMGTDETNQPRRDDPKKNIGWLYPDEFDQHLQRSDPDTDHALAHAVNRT